ncbi:MAG: alkaline phosphatase [Bacteroidales bacterium]|nr:alkaline phosphatase [Bacteroidales bacterium]
MKKNLFLSLRFVSLLLVILAAFSCSHQHDHHDTLDEKPINIILMIGDGMGFAQVHAATLSSGEPLTMLNAQYTGSITTHSYDNLITDSGAGGTALATGKKTNNGMIGMTPDSVAVPSMLDIFAENGKSTGIVVSCGVTHATPASFIAKNVKRSNYEAIALDFLNSPVDVVIGGGIRHFNQRKDGRMLTAEMEEKGFTYLNKLPENASAFNKLLVLTDSVHPVSVLEGRGNLLPEGTKLALQSLSKSKNGFFLMVEGSQIDWAGHGNDSAFLVNEMFDFDKAVTEAFKFADTNPGTLVIVTADHETGGLTLIHGENKNSIKFAFSSSDHSGIMVPVYAYGTGAKQFVGSYDNTDLFDRIMKVAGIQLK